MSLSKTGPLNPLARPIFFLLASLFLMSAGYEISQITGPKPIVGTFNDSKILMSYYGNIIRDTRENSNFRRVIFTGLKSQLVVMNIPPGGEVGTETHKYTEQTLFFLSGTGEGELDGKKFTINPGDVVVVVPGTEHNFRNAGSENLKLYTVYAPPNHIDGRVHATKADADVDTADEAVGESAPLK